MRSSRQLQARRSTLERDRSSYCAGDHSALSANHRNLRISSGIGSMIRLWSPQLAALLLLQACATGPTRQQADLLRQEITQSDYSGVASTAVAVGKIDWKGGGDELWKLNAGSAFLHAGDPQKSIVLLDEAETQATQTDLNAINLGPGYLPRVYDMVMVNSYKALSFLEAGDETNARVEFNRMSDRQRRAEDFYAKEIAAAQGRADKQQKQGGINLSGPLQALKKDDQYNAAVRDMSRFKNYGPFVNPLPIYIHGLFFLANTNQPDASRARDSLKRVLGMVENKALINADLKLAEDKLRGKPVLPMTWVIFENGQSPLFESYSVPIPVPVLKKDGGIELSVVTVALPRMQLQPLAYPGFDVVATGGQSHSTTLSDFDSVMGAEFNKRYPSIILSAVTEVALKIAAQSAANQTDNGMLKLLTLVGSQISTADTRSWILLPKAFEVARLSTPVDGVLQVQPNGGKAITVKVDPSKSSIVFVKAMYPGSPLVANVFPL